MIEMKREKDYLYAFLLGPIFGAVIIFYLMLDAAVAGLESNNALDLNTQIIEQFDKASQDADISMIMIGNSRLRYAATFGFDPQEIVTLPDGRTMAALQFANNAAEFSYYGGFSDNILLARPDYIVLMDMLLTNLRPPGRGAATKYSKMIYEAWIERRKGMNSEDAWHYDRHHLQLACYAYYTPKFMNDRIAATAARDRHYLDPEVNDNIPAIREFIRKARAMGTKVIILHLPLNTDVLDEYGVPYHYLNAYGLGAKPTKQQMLPELHDDVIWMNYPEKIGRNHYCDFIHLNKAGRAKFTEWFLREIDKLDKPQYNL
jgi:hypothetical protein